MYTLCKNSRVFKAILLIDFIFCLTGNMYAQNRGLLKPQDKNTLPVSETHFTTTVKLKEKQVPTPRLQLLGNDEYSLQDGWEMVSANNVADSGTIISQRGYKSDNWFNAVVPGTVLTTLVSNGVYADPAFGLNNLLIPDTLCRQKWWYRSDFTITKEHAQKSAIITFNGINYGADVWVNGNYVGDMLGAFKRGIFNVTSFIHEGTNTIAVLIIPPPHPGIPHEESPRAGTGPNGGALCADGPTFISSEGWDWVPGIRDRNIGIWQDVVIKFVDDILIEDPQVITTLPLPDTTSADVTIKMHVKNISSHTTNTTVRASIETIKVDKIVNLAPGEEKEIIFSPHTYPLLHINHPRLWWPDGYGNPELYKLSLLALKEEKVLCSKTVKFGIRELSYELSVNAPQDKSLRIDYRPAKILPLTKRAVFNNIDRKFVEGQTYIPSLAIGVDPKIFTTLTDTSVAPYLVIKVNGKRIFCKGGNWGMDDYMKRTSREFLEPYFRLHRDAHFNMVRNWTGESTEDMFYELCDEYGLLVWNDFWMSTERYNIEPLDNNLFLSNVADVVRRFRNHPSIAIWCARNEGYAPLAMEDSLANIITMEDGTRHYQPNSRYLNLRTSGPWNYQQYPSKYYTSIAQGFSTELGTPSIPTARSMQKMMAKEDVWPMKDVWYYHDLHDGQIAYRKAIDSLYGTPMDLNDFCLKAQMINYSSHRAMFESWNSKLFNKTSGLLLWMSHPAWPSTVWQVYSWDYETFGSYFGAQKACEPVHIQMNLNNKKVVAINTSLKNYDNAKAIVKCYDISGKEVYSQSMTKAVLSNSLTDFFSPQLPAKLSGVYLVRVQLYSVNGSLLSINDYWNTSNGTKNYESLCRATGNKLSIQKKYWKDGVCEFSIKNSGKDVAVAVKLNLLNAQTHDVVLPAYFSDGYFNLLPGEQRIIKVNYNNGLKTPLSLLIGGLNFVEKEYSFQ